MSNYIGTTPDQLYAQLKDRFFYGLRRTDHGELFLGKVDQLKKTDTLTINNPGDPDQNYPNFSEGQNFSEGRDVNHNLVYQNLNYEQYHWDTKDIWYYVNDDGELVARVNQKYTYDENDSSAG
tara:strand:+ start:2081 stop:2449 length:369 start_codon:yes stop_codon:yes gene_type:complete